ncbi:hypothetical protein AYO45_00715 [Gammaproteobacteria bacterium SCGC AG-212-F23]|nr:hypothetical protein AYO45_00715 [Gammaproteobacteria bacterium SCGC AG-212-F23]
MFHFRLPVLGACLLSAFISFGVQAEETTTTTTTVVEKHAIITPAPKAVCTSVAGHWEGSIWIDTHNVCKYENRTEGAAWIADYWSCTTANADGSCVSWTLVPGHWVKTLE